MSTPFWMHAGVYLLSTGYENSLQNLAGAEVSSCSCENRMGGF